jgi:hypothetical protein
LVVVVLCTSTTPILAFIISKFSAALSTSQQPRRNPTKLETPTAVPCPCSCYAWSLSHCSIDVPLLLVVVPWQPVASALSPAPIAPARADASALRPSAEVEVHAVAGSLTGLTNVKVLVPGVVVELVVAPSEISAACDVGSFDLA